MSATSDPRNPRPAGGSAAPALAGLPAWADALGRAYTSGVASVFILHGNLHDVVPVRDASGVARDFVGLERFLSRQLFGRHDIVLQYDRGAGLSYPADGERREHMRQEFRRTLEAIDTVLGTDHARAGLKDARAVFELLDRFIVAKTTARAPDTEGQEGRTSLMAAKKAEIKKWGYLDIQADENNIGIKASPTQVKNIFAPEARSDRKILQGTPEEQVTALVNELKGFKCL